MFHTLQFNVGQTYTFRLRLHSQLLLLGVLRTLIYGERNVKLIGALIGDKEAGGFRVRRLP